MQGILTSLLGFVLLGSLLRFLSSSSYGAYASLQVTISIASAVCLFGLSAAIVRFLAGGLSTGPGQGWGEAKASVILSLALTSVVSLGILVSGPLLSDYFMKSRSWAWVFYIGALWLFASSISVLLQGLLQATRRYSLLAKVLLASKAVAVFIAVLGLSLYHSLAIAIISWVVGGTLVSSVVILLVWRPLFAASAKTHYLQVLRYASPLAAAGLVTAVASNADIVVVGGYLDPTSLGVYNATLVIASILTSLFVLPLVTTLFAETSFSSLTRAVVSRGVSLALRFEILTLLPASFFASAAAPQLFSFLSGGGVYAKGIPYLQLITAFYLFYAIQSVSIYVLQGVGKTGEVLLIGLITALGEIALSVFLVPIFGLSGAAYSRITIMIAGCVISLYYLRGYLEGAVNYRFLAKASVSAGVPAGAVFLLSSIVSDRILTLLPYSFIWLGLFLLCARGFKLLTEEDKSFMAHLLPEGLVWISKIL